MKKLKWILISLSVCWLSAFQAAPSWARISYQCNDPAAKCLHLTGGDGFAYMADGYLQYMFGFSQVDTGAYGPDQVMANYGLAAEWPAPTIELNEGQDLWLTLSNVGMLMRPDLFDPHTVHYHGLPDSSNIFDGLPESGIAINMGSSLTYYYQNNHPGTYMYHCHVEATEHMQMGMLGSLYVNPAQNGNTTLYPSGLYVYNDGDGTTGYDVAYPIQLGGFDKEFHDASLTVQPLPFATMWDDYPMINGRGYPDTVGAANAIPAPPEAKPKNQYGTTQPVSSLMTATAGQRILLRVSNLNVTRFHTIAVYGISMKVVGKDARQLKSESGTNLYYNTNSLTLGGGESYDVILDTAGILPGTYYLFAANLNLLSNDEQQYGGMMTEIVIQ